MAADDLQANGNITGSAGNSASGGRDITAFFGEVLVPVLDSFSGLGSGLRPIFLVPGAVLGPFPNMFIYFQMLLCIDSDIMK